MLLSVVIPTYNRCGLLLGALSSVLAQTTAADEIIVVDDGSTDCTERLMRLITQRSSRTVSQIRYHRIEHCGFVGRVRNIGVQLAQGELVAFLDDDDLWVPAKLQLQLAAHRRRPALVLSHTAEHWLDRGTVLAHNDLYCDDGVALHIGKDGASRGNNMPMFNKRDTQHMGGSNEQKSVSASYKMSRGVSAKRFFDACLHKCIIGPSTVIVQRSAIVSDGGFVGGFRSDLRIAEDYELWIRLCSAHQVGYVATPLTIKCAGGWRQLSKQYHYIEKFRIEALKGVLDANLLSKHQTEQALQVLRHKIDIWCNGCIKRGRENEAAHYRVLLKHYTSLVQSD